MPIRYSTYVRSNLDWTYTEIEQKKKYLKWEEVSINWEEVNLTWDEVIVILEGGGATHRGYIDENPWKQIKKELGEEKTKKVIKVYCRVKGIDYEQVKEPIEDIKITINEFERFVKEAINVKIGF